jgi:Cdc6-like AAA superfamily ATPase
MKIAGQKRIAIHGMPGVGKTQLVLQLSNEWRKLHPECHVFFVDAAENENLVQGFQRMHRLLRLAREQHQDIIIEGVKQWLVQHTNWLLLIDNVVRTDIIRPFLPAGGDGCIVFTSRSEGCARNLGTTGRLHLVPFTGEEAAVMLFKAIDVNMDTASEQSRNNAQEIGILLGGLPIALEGSAALIADRNWTLSTLVDKLRSSKSETLNQSSGRSSI